MSDSHYSNLEIDLKLDLILETVKRVEEQTNKTNGRVTALEIRADKNDRMHAWLAGAMFIMGSLFAVIGSWIATHITGVKIS